MTDGLGYAVKKLCRVLCRTRWNRKRRPFRILPMDSGPVGLAARTHAERFEISAAGSVKNWNSFRNGIWRPGLGFEQSHLACRRSTIRTGRRGLTGQCGSRLLELGAGNVTHLETGGGLSALDSGLDGVRHSSIEPAHSRSRHWASRHQL